MALAGQVRGMCGDQKLHARCPGFAECEQRVFRYDVAGGEHEVVPAQFTVQSATVEMSLTKMRLPETAGAGQVALSATV
jgi:hypothetical protein